jgi:uncharacterized protein (TIGR00304 family)
MDVQTLYSFGTILSLVGVLVIIAAFILLERGKKTGRVKGGGAIIIGPVPIVFGTDKESLRTVLLLSIILTALLIVLVTALHFLST